MNELLFDVVKIVVAVMAVLISTYLVPYLKSLARNEKYARLVEFVSTAVHAAEQTIKGDGRGGERKHEVLKQVRGWLNGRGIDVTEEQLNILVEAAVYNMNRFTIPECREYESVDGAEKDGPLYAD